jgi:hypothetical protein
MVAVADRHYMVVVVVMVANSRLGLNNHICQLDYCSGKRRFPCANHLQQQQKAFELLD